MEFGKYNNLQFIKSHLPQINIPKTQQMSVNIFQLFLTGNTTLNKKLEKYYIKVSELARHKSYEKLELETDYPIYTDFYQWCCKQKKFFNEIYEQFEKKKIMIRSDCFEDNDKYSSAGLFNSKVMKCSSSDEIIKEYCRLIESFLSLRTIYQLNFNKTISYKEFILSIDVFFQEFLENKKSISEDIAPELDEKIIHLIFKNIQLLTNLFKFPIDSEWVLETTDNLKVSIVAFSTSDNVLEFTCAFGLGKVVSKTLSYTSYYKHRDDKEIFFSMQGSEKRIVTGDKLFLVQARRLHGDSETKKSLILNHSDIIVPSYLLSYSSETYGGQLLLAYDVFTAWDRYIKQNYTKPIVVVIEGNGFEHEILRFKEEKISVYKVQIEQYYYLQCNINKSNFVSDHVRKKLVIAENPPKYEFRSKNETTTYRKLMVPTSRKIVTSSNFSTIDKILNDFLLLKKRNNNNVKVFLESIPNTIQWKVNLLLIKNHDLNFYEFVKKFLLEDDKSSVLFEYKKYLLKHRVKNSFYYYQETISDDIIEMIAEDFYHFNLDKHKIKNSDLKLVQSFYIAATGDFDQIDNKLSYIKLSQKVQNSLFFKEDISLKKYKLLQLIHSIESGLFYDANLIINLINNYNKYSEDDICNFFMLQNYGILNVEILRFLSNNTSFYTEFRIFLDSKITFSNLYLTIESVKNRGHQIQPNYVYQNCLELVSLYNRIRYSEDNIFWSIFCEEFQKNIELCDLYLKQVAKEFVDDIGKYENYRKELVKWFRYSKYFLILIESKYRTNYIRYCAESFNILKKIRNTSMVIGYGYDNVWYNEIKKSSKSETNLHKLHNIIHQIQLKSVNSITNFLMEERIKLYIPVLSYFDNFKSYLSKNYLKIFFDLTIHRSEVVFSPNYLSIEYAEAPRGKDKGHDREHIARLQVLDKLLEILTNQLKLPYFSEIIYSLTNYRLIAKIEFGEMIQDRFKNQLLSDLILLMNLTFDFSKVDNKKVSNFISKINYLLLREILDCIFEILNSTENINFEELSKLFTVISQDDDFYKKIEASKHKKNLLLDALRIKV